MVTAKMNWSTKRSKYHNDTVEVDGIRYDSRGEYQRHCFLKLMERAGEITNLRYHVKYELIPAIIIDDVVYLKTKTKAIKRTIQTARYYEADFVYTVNKTGEEVVEDFKGHETDLFKFQAALFFWKYGKHIRIVKQINEDIY